MRPPSRNMHLYLALALSVVRVALAHGDHSNNMPQQPMVDENADWMTRHMSGRPAAVPRLLAEQDWPLT
jgi:hypothetical protein